MNRVVVKPSVSPYEDGGSRARPRHVNRVVVKPSVRPTQMGAI
jgi:hypothetical protein